MMEDWLKVGTVGRPHGLRGAFFVSNRSEPLPASCKDVVIGRSPESGLAVKITQNRPQKLRSVVVVSSIQDRTHLGKYAGQDIWALSSAISVDDNREYLWSELPGRSVVDVAGVTVGVVANVNNYGASDILEIVNESGDTLTLPFVDQYFDMDFDRDNSPLGLVVTAAETFDGLWQVNAN